MSRPATFLARAATAAAGAAVAATLLAASDARSEDRKPLDFEAVIETAKAKVFPALVFVRPGQEDLSAGEKRRVEVFGSGVIVSPDGYVVTNHHVAEKAKEIRCVLHDRSQVDAKVVGLDRATDIALLKLSLAPGQKVPSASLGTSSTLAEGQFVMALGAPYGFERSISLGIVSNAKRHLGDSDEYPYNNWIQTDAAINPGNSGGPLVDTRGTVVGIDTLGMGRASGLGFAVPVDVVKRVIDRLRSDGRVRRSRSGLTLRPLVDYLHNTVFSGDKGAIVDDVAPGSAAEKAGVRKGDRLLAVGGVETNAKYREDLPEIRWTIADLPAGRPAPVAVEREGVRMDLTLTPAVGLDDEEEGLDAPRWNATFQTITPERVPDLAFFRPEGVYVLGVKYPGNAAVAGLREGDVVLAVDRKPVATLADVKAVYDAVLREDRSKKVVLLEVLRGGHKRHVALAYERDYEKDQ
jgi:S1-C subfamily serine protease